jgi:hypothetical protein
MPDANSFYFFAAQVPAPHAAAPLGAFFAGAGGAAEAFFASGFFAGSAGFAGSAAFAGSAGAAAGAGVAGVFGVGVAVADEPDAADVSAAFFASGAGVVGAGGAVSVEFTGALAGFGSPPHAEMTTLVPRTASAPAIFSTDR